MAIGKMVGSPQSVPGPKVSVAASALDLMVAIGGDKGNAETRDLLTQLRDAISRNESLVETCKVLIKQANEAVDAANKRTAETDAKAQALAQDRQAHDAKVRQDEADLTTATAAARAETARLAKAKEDDIAQARRRLDLDIEGHMTESAATTARLQQREDDLKSREDAVRAGADENTRQAGLNRSTVERLTAQASDVARREAAHRTAIDELAALVARAKGDPA